jgi:hypothetical protein
MSVECDGGLTGEGHRVVGEGHCEVECGEVFAVDVVDAADHALTGGVAVDRGDRGEAHLVGPQLFQREVVREKPREVGHGEHAVGEDVVQTG